MSTPLVSIIIPTYNAASHLRAFFESCKFSENRDFEIIVNDDIRTSDSTERDIDHYRHDLTIRYEKENKKMAQARKKGAEYARGDILVHLDSDMKITPGLIGEIIDLMQSYDALIIDEESYGTTFWARCKWLEKRCYRGVRPIESLRVIRKDIYEILSGHDENLIFSEDKDLDLRVQKAGYKIGRVRENFLWHNEGDLQLSTILKKKLSYSRTADRFREKHPEAYAWQVNIFSRYMIFLRKVRYLFSHPFLYIGMIFMKTSEFSAGIWGILHNQFTKGKL